MGKITLYHEMVLGQKISKERLSFRVSCCLSLGSKPKIALEDWFSWYYLMLELVLNELAVYAKLNLNAEDHNMKIVFRKLTNPYDPRGCYLDDLVVFLESSLGIPSLLHDNKVSTIMSLRFSDIRYRESYLEHLRTLDIGFLCLFLKALHYYLVKLY